MNEHSETYEKEISLVELMFYCLKKWRCIVLSMIIVAAAAGGYKYISTVKGNQLKEQQALLEKENMNEAEEEAEEAGPVKNPNVVYYEQIIANSEQELEKQDAYLKDSVIMQLDARHLQTATVSFYLNVEDEQGANALENLVSAYEAYVMDGRLADQLYGIDPDISKGDLQYLLSFSCDGKDNYRSTSTTNFQAEQGGGVLEVHVAMPEQVIFQVQAMASGENVCREYLSQIEKAVIAYSNELKEEIAGHRVELMASVQSEMASDDIQKYQTDAITSYTTLLTNLQTLRKGLQTVISEEGEMLTVREEIVLANPVSAAGKYAIAGLVLGAFLAGFVLILVCLINGKLQNTDKFQEQYGMCLLGEIKASVGKKKLLGFIDTWIYHLEAGAYANIPYEEQIRIASANLKAMIAKRGKLKKVMIAGTIAAKDAAVSEELTKNIDGIIFTDYQQPVFSAAALEELESSDAVLFLEKRGVSVSRLIHQERDLANSRNVDVLGVIIL